MPPIIFVVWAVTAISTIYRFLFFPYFFDSSGGKRRVEG